MCTLIERSSFSCPLLSGVSAAVKTVLPRCVRRGNGLFFLLWLTWQTLKLTSQILASFFKDWQRLTLECSTATTRFWVASIRPWWDMRLHCTAGRDLPALTMPHKTLFFLSSIMATDCCYTDLVRMNDWHPYLLHDSIIWFILRSRWAEAQCKVEL